MSDEIKINDPEFIRAQTELVREKTLGQKLDNQLAEAVARTSQIALEREIQREKWENASAANHRVYYLIGEINTNASLSAIDTLTRWDRIDPEDREIKLVISSPGGDVVAGFQLYSYLSGLAERRRLVISAAGLCASMATIIHQAGTERVIEPGCSYLLHEVSGQLGGRYDTISDTAGWLNRLNQSMHKIFADRSGGIKTEEEIAAAVGRRECWLMPNEVIEWGLADRIGYVS